MKKKLCIMLMLMLSISGWAQKIGEYNPQNPADPYADGYSHNVRIYAAPSAGGYFNSSSFILLEGKTTNIYAYPREGYRFESWTSNGEVVSTDNPLTIKMGTADISYTATFVYNPVSPGDPSANKFNPATGEVIIDNFTPGSLNSAICTAVGSSDNYTLVQSILVIGRMQSSDFGFARGYQNCSHVDLSRTTGYTEIPSWSFEGMVSLKDLYLPMNVEHVGANAFNGCSTLKDIYLYAVTPPTLAENALMDLDKSVSLHVPSSAVTLYAATDGWNKLNIQSLDQNEKSVTVNLPGAAGDYKNMTLELQNMQSGQVYRYLVTNRISYTFFGLMKNTYYNIYLKNSSGVVLGEVNNVALEDKNLNVSFEKIQSTHDVVLSVFTPDGRNVSADVTVTWFDDNGNYLRQGSNVTELLVGTNVQYQLKLSKDLAVEYIQPEVVAYEVKDNNNSITFTLTPIKRVIMNGCVKDATTKLGISGATVSLSQTLNGKYSKTIIAKTDSKGYYTATVYNAPTSLAVSAYDYVKQITEVAIDPSAENVTVDDIAMPSIFGATINVSFTYTPSVAEGEMSEIQNWYDDYQNVVYSIHNMTTGKEVTQVSVRFPQLVILNGAKAGDKLRIIATSKKDAFMPVTVVGTVDSENRMDIVVPIKQYGGIRAFFEHSINSEVVGILYDGKGFFINAFDYDDEAVMTVPALKDGKYTLITMGKDSYFNSIYSLSQLLHVGLIKDVDYCRNDFAVTSGVTLVANVGIVPELDTSRYKYIGEGTTFTVNKSSIVAGNYLTFSSIVDFFAEYGRAISGVELIVDIPESASFVEKSLLVGSSVSEYSLEGNRITIPLNNYNRKDKVRFCVIPKEKGSYAPSAFLRFMVDNKEKIVAIGSAKYEVESFSIIVPKTVVKKTVTVRGTSLPGSKVEIYDNDIVIAQLETPANGSWNVLCELANANNLSTHPIYAKVTTGDAEVLSETQECYYDMSANGVKTVTMTHYNAYYKRNMDVVFDIENGTTTPGFYYFYTAADYSFIVDFIDNDTSAVSNVSVYAFDYNGNATRMIASYDSKTNKWVANHKFSSYNSPVNVSVDFCRSAKAIGDRDELNSKLDDVKFAFETMNDNIARMYSSADIEDTDIANLDIYTEIDKLIESEIIDEEKIRNLLRQLIESDTEYNEDVVSDFDESDFIVQQHKADSLYSSIIRCHVDSILAAAMINKDVYKYFPDKSFSCTSQDGKYEYIIKMNSALDEKGLEKQGFSLIEMTDGSIVWIKQVENETSFVDPKNSLEIILKKHEFNMTRASFNNVTDIPTSCIDAVSEMVAMFTDGTDRKVWQRNIEVSKMLMDALQCFYEVVYAYITDPLNAPDFKKTMMEKLLAEKAKKNEWLSFMNSKKIKSAKEWMEQEAHLKDIEKNITKCRRSINDAWQSQNNPIMRLIKKLPKRLTQDAPRLDNSIRTLGRVSGGLGLILNIHDVYCDCRDMNKDARSWDMLQERMESKLPCIGNEVAANQLKNQIWSDSRALHNNYIRIIAADIAALLADVTSASGYLKNPQALAALYFGSVYAKLYTELSKTCSIDGKFLTLKNNYSYRIATLRCKKYEDSEAPQPETKDAEIVEDPSGYVYEGVSSNRLQGVTATAYYMETTEDMYGVLHDEPKVWDAEEYSQENPLFTDENGMYQWDVPQGLWQVKFEKEGYETTYSEWLPVPPPQLEVNIAMTQARQPEVKRAHAYEDGVVVEFDKYMLPSLLTTDNILVSQNGKYVEGEVKLLNEETAYRDENVKYVSKVRFVPKTPFTSKEVTLTVANRVKSYAGLQMQDSYQQTLDIERELKEIKVETELNITTSKEHTLLVEVFPVAASSGKSLNVKSSSDMIVKTSSKTYLLDEEGKVNVIVEGEQPGSAALTFSVEGYDLSATTSVNVSLSVNDYCATPTASVTSGSKVSRGTEIRLFCATDNAVIYYTLDGSCPCDESGARMTYDGTPIVINKDVTIKAMAVAEGIGESDVAEFTYTIKKESLKYYTHESLVKTLEDREGWTSVLQNTPNAVAVVESAQTEWASLQKNVMVTNGDGYYKCADFQLTDLSQGYSSSASEAAKTGFFTPVTFKVTKGNYKRQAYAGYNTLCLPFSFKASELSSSAKVFTFDSYDEDKTKVIFKAVNGTIEAGTPCIVKEKSNVVWTVNLAGKTVVANQLSEETYMRGTYVTTDSYQGKGYAPRSSDNKFAPLTQYLHPFRACFLLDELDNADARGSINAVFMDEDGATVIDEINATDNVADAPKAIYTLSGQRVNEVKRSGLYIVNGEKQYIEVK